MKYIALAFLACFAALPLYAELPLGKVPPVVTLSGKRGGRLDGTAWSSAELKGKVYILFYVDPDEKDLNEHVSQRLAREKHARKKVGSVAIINMDATWMPNFAIESALKEKQEKYKDTIYVKDFEKVLVKGWNLADDSNDIVAFDSFGKVIFSKDGKLSEEEIEELLRTVRQHI